MRVVAADSMDLSKVVHLPDIPGFSQYLLNATGPSRIAFPPTSW